MAGKKESEVRSGNASSIGTSGVNSPTYKIATNLPYLKHIAPNLRYLCIPFL